MIILELLIIEPIIFIINKLVNYFSGLFNTVRALNKFRFVSSITERPIRRLLTVAKPYIFCFGCYILNWSVLGHLFDRMSSPKHFMRSIAKRLIIAIATSAYIINFTFFDLKLKWQSFIHSALS